MRAIGEILTLFPHAMLSEFVKGGAGDAETCSDWSLEKTVVMSQSWGSNDFLRVVGWEVARKVHTNIFALSLHKAQLVRYKSLAHAGFHTGKARGQFDHLIKSETEVVSRHRSTGEHRD